MTLVIVGAANRERMDDAVAVFEAAGYTRVEDLDAVRQGDLVFGVSDGGADLLREADRRAIKYVLVHDGEDDHHLGGSFERAHHRIEAGQRGELAQHLRGRERPLITCLAFAYKNGPPSDAALLIQPAAGRLLDDVQRIVRDLLPLYREKGRMHLVVAFGCTGGRHRSVVLAQELSERLRKIEGVDVDFVTRDID